VRAPCILVQRWGTMLQLLSAGNIDSAQPCTGSVKVITRSVKRLILTWYSAEVLFLSLDQNQSSLQGDEDSAPVRGIPFEPVIEEESWWICSTRLTNTSDWSIETPNWSIGGPYDSGPTVAPCWGIA
jgi:hypothetical protein